MITELTEQHILNTVIERLNLGDMINAERIINIRTEYYTDGNFTMCKLYSIVGNIDKQVASVGFSKRNPNYPQYKYNQLIGETLAFVEASKRYIKQLEQLGKCY